MQGRDIKTLAATAYLVKLDNEAAALTLISEDGVSLTSVYQGNYSGGWRQIGADVPPMRVAIDAQKFKQYANLFEDDDTITLKVEGAELALRSETSKLNLATRTDPHDIDEIGRGFNSASFIGALSMPAKDLLAEIEIASKFVSDTNFRPIFTGVHLQAANNELTLTAFDGFTILFRSTIPTRTTGELDMTVMATDLLLGLRLVAESGNIVMGRLKDKDSVVIYDMRKTAMFRCALLAGAWPDMSNVTNQPRVGSTVVLPSNLIKLLSNAGDALGVSTLTLQPGKGTKAFFTLQGEVGSYATTFSGSEKLTEPVSFALESIKQLGALGNNISLLVPPMSSTPVIADATHRCCWILTMNR